MTPKPLDPKTKERYAFLVGLGLTGDEAARACEIGTTTGDRIMAQPEYRQIAEDAKRGRGLQGDVARNVAEMLGAVNASGEPNWLAREKAMALFLKDPELFLPEGSAEELLPEGVIEVYPVPPEARAAASAAEDEAEPTGAEWQVNFLAARLGLPTNPPVESSNLDGYDEGLPE